VNKIRLAVFVLIVVSTFIGSYAHAAEEVVMTQSGIASRLTQSGAFTSPFQVVVDKSGRLTIKPNSVFSEGTQDPKLELPQLLTKPEPIALPSWMLSQKWEGEVVLAVAVKIDGTINETMVMKTSGEETLDRWARELVHNWQFRPAMKNGKAVYECIQIPILFKPEPVE